MFFSISTNRDWLGSENHKPARIEEQIGLNKKNSFQALDNYMGAGSSRSRRLRGHVEHHLHNRATAETGSVQRHQVGPCHRRDTVDLPELERGLAAPMAVHRGCRRSSPESEGGDVWMS